MNCIQATRSIIQQIEQLLGQLSAEAYAKPLNVFDGGTLGQHFRHIYDFYECLSRGQQEGQVDYADRRRQHQLETDPRYSQLAFRQIAATCQSFQEDVPLKIRADFSSEQEEERPLVGSTIGRELMFAYDHAIHHLAIVKIGLREAMPGLKVAENLGIAPSTVKHKIQTIPTEGRS